jgi:hypothetical protein
MLQVVAVCCWVTVCDRWGVCDCRKLAAQVTKAVRSKDGGLPEVRVLNGVDGGINLHVVCQCGNMLCNRR